MNNIDDLFTEIEEKERMEPEYSMDTGKQKRIEALIMSGIRRDIELENKNENINEMETINKIKNMNNIQTANAILNASHIRKTNKSGYSCRNLNEQRSEYELKNSDVRNITEFEKRSHRISKRGFVALILAATFLLGMTAVAAQRNEWDIAIVNFMGISNADTVQLKDGVVEIGASSVSNGVTMTAVTSVGDKNSAYIRIDTDYQLPKDFSDVTDYILPEDLDIAITKNEMEVNTDHSATWMYFNNHGFLSFMLYISNCEGINRKKVTLSLSDLNIYHDLRAEGVENDNTEVDHGTLLLNGKWTFSWKYSYRSNTDTYYPLKMVTSGGNTCLVTKLEISPITIRTEALKNPKEGATESSRLVINKITLKDGSVIEFDPDSISGGCRDNTFLNGYRDVIEMGKAIDPSEVYSVTIGDTEIIIP